MGYPAVRHARLATQGCPVRLARQGCPAAWLRRGDGQGGGRPKLKGLTPEEVPEPVPCDVVLI